ncbi:MAG: Sugar-phosphate isomerase, RpiB/LacA/LacB family [Microgenomates group bacterium GW2011_GWC1_37_8]|uniref:Sugar-phosphate isomerase, RpiB/LacA/LacB family n=1 Tax=Candidatus Woesebacteria bacterium GW2011_GWB1_38_8 TaxID=1618570 RepID=A0A0G0P8P8_9BACT|nr:MAG: Sugar-phosphate isomerase, RpiB/LacA/LacB family [Microgenomates group bacterium GW2011_GWC1_37_8]KKQ85681.1 MAG: Sugar-phosphate isomerase, RpiB/LacA/LacB family [Candidatus Woesebacteria bacterium GW2011_GWB1_38_8]
MKVYLGSDHRGFKLKEKIAKWLFEWGYEFEDMGAEYLNPADDYTVYAERVASIVRDRDTDRGEEVRGILLCGSGVGVDIVANKFDGVRASIGKSAEQVKTGRADDDMNILVIAADFTNEDEAKKMVKVFIETGFEAKARYKRRLEDIKRIEANN